MLVLSRRQNESVQIGSDIRVSVVSVRGNVVRLGFRAPDDVAILRSELVEQSTKGPHPVLIVDDCPEDRYTCRRLLSQKSSPNFQITEAESGEEALDHCRKQRVDCILLDYLLPDLTGLEFFEQLREQQKLHLPPVVMMTSQGNEQLAVQAMKRGMADYLVKGSLTRSTLQKSVLSAVQHSVLLKNLVS